MGTGTFSQKKPVIIAYYSGNGNDIEKYPLQKLDQLIYSFMVVKADTLAFKHENQPAILQKMTSLKLNYPSLKVTVAMGGWGGCANCSEAFSTPEGREKFAVSVLKILVEYKADGIDLDWEYPAIPGPPGHRYHSSDRDNFTDLVKRLHQHLAPRYEISFAAGGFSRFLEESIDWKAVMPLVNRVNLMTYDLVHGYSTQTGHHAGLYSSGSQKESADYCVTYLLKAGVQPEKLVIGAAAYARVWKDVPDQNRGLFQTGKFENSPAYSQFKEKLSAETGWIHYWDSTAMAPYGYNEPLKKFATYDNESSIAAKMAYLKKFKLGGIMYWELSNDRFVDGILDAMFKNR